MKANVHAAGNPIPTNGDSISVTYGSASEPRGLYAHSALNQAMGLYLPATVIFRLINFGRILLLTWFMLRQQFGLLTMILLVLNVMTPLCSLGLNEAITRYVPYHEARGTLWTFMWRSFGLLLAVTTISVAVICVFAQPLGEFFYAQVFENPKIREEFIKDAPELARLSAVVTGLLIIYFYLLAILKGLRMFTALSVMEMAHGVVFLALSIVAVYTGHRSANTMTALYGVALLVPILYFGQGLISSVWRWKAQHHASDDAEWIARLIRFSVWTTLAGVTWQILVYYPQWYLNRVHGHDAVAVFSAVRQLGNFMLTGAVSIVTVVMTIVTKTWESRGREAAQRQLSLAFRGAGLGLLFVCIALALGKNVIMLMFRSEYRAGASILPLQLLFFLIGSYLAFLPIHFHLTEKTRHLFWPWAVGVASNVLCAIWLAGPASIEVKRFAVWQWLAPITTRIFTVGFSDPLGMDAAAWCGVFAIGTALILCVILIRAECTRLDRGTYFIIAASLILALKTWLLIAGTVILFVIAFGTQIVFSHDERRRVRKYVFETLLHIPTGGLMKPRKSAPIKSEPRI